jgi:putative ABC transport system permease protein
VLQTWTAGGAPNIQDFTICGIFRTGFAPLVRGTALVSLADAQALADTGDCINKLFVKCEDSRTAEEALPGIAALAAQAGCTAQSWRTYAVGLLRHAQRETYFYYYVFLAILFALSISTITNTVYVSVFERTREIGSLRAIGWRRGEIFRLLPATP